ncbi:MAG: hypothetical protein ACFBSC_18720 [Microcoleaceae cyanobacterium]
MSNKLSNKVPGKLLSKPASGLKAQIHPFLQPRFWGPIGLLLILGGAIWQVVEDPQQQLDGGSLSTSADPGSLSNRLTDEERAIAADIDSSGVLFQQLEEFEQPTGELFGSPIVVDQKPLDIPQSAELNGNSANPFLQGAADNRNGATSPSNEYDLLNLEAVRGSAATATSSSTNGSGTGSATPGATEESAGSKDPLQAAMDRALQSESADQDETAASGSGELTSEPTSNSILPETTGAVVQVAPTNVQVNPSTGTQSGVSNSATSTNPVPASGLLQPAWTVPQSTVNPLTTGIAPVAPNPYQTNRTVPQYNVPVQSVAPANSRLTTASPSYSRFYPGIGNNAGLELTNPGFYRNNPAVPTTQTAQPNVQNFQVNPNSPNNSVRSNVLLQPQQPFSVPRPIPGRTIGGGQINTFSNP